MKKNNNFGLNCIIVFELKFNHFRKAFIQTGKWLGRGRGEKHGKRPSVVRACQNEEQPHHEDHCLAGKGPLFLQPLIRVGDREQEGYEQSDKNDDDKPGFRGEWPDK